MLFTQAETLAEKIKKRLKILIVFLYFEIRLKFWVVEARSGTLQKMINDFKIFCVKTFEVSMISEILGKQKIVSSSKFE